MNNTYEEVLRAVGGWQGIVQCCLHYNNSPLLLVLEAAEQEIAKLKKREEAQPWKQQN